MRALLRVQLCRSESAGDVERSERHAARKHRLPERHQRNRAWSAIDTTLSRPDWYVYSSTTTRFHLNSSSGGDVSFLQSAATCHRGKTSPFDTLTHTRRRAAQRRAEQSRASPVREDGGHIRLPSKCRMDLSLWRSCFSSDPRSPLLHAAPPPLVQPVHLPSCWLPPAVHCYPQTSGVSHSSPRHPCSAAPSPRAASYPSTS